MSFFSQNVFDELSKICTPFSFSKCSKQISKRLRNNKSSVYCVVITFNEHPSTIDDFIGRISSRFASDEWSQTVITRFATLTLIITLLEENGLRHKYKYAVYHILLVQLGEISAAETSKQQMH